jgi:cytochrome P450
MAQRWPPGPPDPGLFEMIRSVNRDRLTFLEHAATYGPIVHFRVGLQHAVLLNEPEWVEDVLVRQGQAFGKGIALQRAKVVMGEGLLTSEGPLHLRQRRLVQPAFHRARVASYAAAMVNHAARVREAWTDGQAIDVVAEMNRLTLAIVADTLFGADVGADADRVRTALTTIIEMFNLTMVPMVRLLLSLPLPMSRRFKAALAELDRLIYRMIADRRRSGEDRGDLLSMLLLAQDTDEGTGGMSDSQLRDEVITLFLAGHETTANALAWTWFLLGTNPEAETALHEELDRVLGDRLPSADDVPQLEYTRQVLAESMRLYPPAWVIGRRTLRDYEVGGYTIPPDTLVLVSQWLLHRDPRFWADPSRYDPGRFAPEAQRGRPRFAYFPFGAGTRVCIGESFAWTEGVLLLATLAVRWRIRLRSSDPPPRQGLITLRPGDAIAAQVVRRR